MSPVKHWECILTIGVLFEPSFFMSATCSIPVNSSRYPYISNCPNSVGKWVSTILFTCRSVFMRYLIKSATVISFIECVLANSNSSSRLAIVPSGFRISQITPDGVRPANLAKSTAVSVCPDLFKTPPSLAIRGKMCPGRLKSFADEVLSFITCIVFALSNAEIPVVVPYFGSASTLCVKFVKS